MKVWPSPFDNAMKKWELTLLTTVVASCPVIFGQEARLDKLRLSCGAEIARMSLASISSGAKALKSLPGGSSDRQLSLDPDAGRIFKRPEAADSVSETCVVSNGYGCIEVMLVGARIVSWCDTEGREILFMPEERDSAGSEWSHGGIPLCWPWFGRNDEGIHGFIRTKRFSILSKTKNGVVLRYSLNENEEPLFPYAAEIVVEIRLNDGLEIEMSTQNCGNESFCFTCGIHPYFAVSDYDALSFIGVDKVPFDCVDGMDRAFSRASDGKFCVMDRAMGCSFLMRAVGNSHVIVWTPGTKESPNRNLKAQDMRRFVGCGPAFTKLSEAHVLRPSESHKMSFRVLVVKKIKEVDHE